MRRAIDIAQGAGILGDSIMDSGKAFDMEVRVGAGAYVCGEETSLLNSLEGKRGVVRAKPPLPAIAGLFRRAFRVYLLGRDKVYPFAKSALSPVV